MFPIYYPPAVTFDKHGTIWVYWGTGDREDPINKNSRERFYAVKDDGGADSDHPYTEGDLQNVTGDDKNKFTPYPNMKGWYIQLEESEKVLARPAVFAGLVYFTSFLPRSVDPCSVGGDARLYVLEYLSGGGATVFSDALYMAGTTSDRFIHLGEVAPSAPIISVNTKGQASVIVGTMVGGVYSAPIYSDPSNKQLLYWREVIR